MAIIVAHRIREKEFGSALMEEDREILRRTARAALAKPIASKGLPPGSRLLKAYATTRRGPRRVVYLLAVDAGDLFLLFFRDKNNAVGKNVSSKNEGFRTQLKKYLVYLREDIDAGRIEVIDTTPS